MSCVRPGCRYPRQAAHDHCSTACAHAAQEERRLLQRLESLPETSTPHAQVRSQLDGLRRRMDRLNNRPAGKVADGTDGESRAAERQKARLSELPATATAPGRTTPAEPEPATATEDRPRTCRCGLHPGGREHASWLESTRRRRLEGAERNTERKARLQRRKRRHGRVTIPVALQA